MVSDQLDRSLGRGKGALLELDQGIGGEVVEIGVGKEVILEVRVHSMCRAACLCVLVVLSMIQGHCYAVS